MTIKLADLRPRPRPSSPARAVPPQLSPTLVRYLDGANAAMGEPFRGVTTDGRIVPGLFPLRDTGVSTRPVQEAAEAFLASLDVPRRANAALSVDDEAWLRWSNIHPYLFRHGVCLEDLSAAQRDRALGLLREGLSARGFDLARDIMWLNHTSAELTGRFDEYGEWYYWLSVFGEPSADEPWGWQIDGHHLIVNSFVVGDQLVMTPMFMGSEPTVAEGGKYAGTRVFETEEQVGLALVGALTADERRKALVSDELPREVFTTSFRDNFELKYEGIPADELSSDQQGRLLRLVETYVGGIRPGHAEVRMDEVREHLAETYFAWMGGFDDESVFYYRVHSPVILIEFDHLPGIAFDNDEPSRNHIHTVVRTPNGNDYGRDLLRQHREQHAHAHP